MNKHLSIPNLNLAQFKGESYNKFSLPRLLLVLLAAAHLVSAVPEIQDSLCTSKAQGAYFFNQCI